MNEILSRILFVDIETRGDAPYALGATLGSREIRASSPSQLPAALDEMDRLAGEAWFVAGHNVLAHDLPVLRAVRPGAAFARLPVVDTLLLSPLAFPENPYHRLVKDYKLVRATLNDPVADARLAAQLLADEAAAFVSLAQGAPELPAFHLFCLQHVRSAGSQLGFAQFFQALELRPLADAATAREVFHRLAIRNGCAHAACPEHLEWPALAYALAWLRVSGSNSIVPPWVRREFPGVLSVINAVRETPCRQPDCAYCVNAHQPRAQLQRFFGFPAFRAEPAAPDGGSLQEAVVAAGMRGQPFLAVLPTGAGKSLCFQLPALARNFRRGSVTVVLSPLQALMKDQVDNLLVKTGTHMAAAISGLLTMPERADALERLRLGDVAVLYLSPEQLRNSTVVKALAQREVGAWVFDEAHCLSRWGHDFRPDYLYAGRFIREFSREQGVTPAPVYCVTATAKPEVVAEIRDYFRAELQQELLLFESTAERSNLAFEVEPVTAAEKWGRVLQLVTESLPPGESAAAVIYSSTREGAERLAQFLAGKGLAAAAFHAGLSPAEKRDLQEAFIVGRLSVICATNAFGMGIDKENVRLVVHADIPGSLENYIQEAGRAGRDQAPARCVLLYDPADIETQFGLGAMSRLTRQEVAGLLRLIRQMRRGEEAEVVFTAGELLRSDDGPLDELAGDRSAETKVKAAIALLERGRFVERNENRNTVFQGRPLVASADEAVKRMEQLRIPAAVRTRWLAVLGELMNAPPDQGISADHLAGLSCFREEPATGASSRYARSETLRVMKTLHDMADAGLVKSDALMTAFVRHKIADASLTRLQQAAALEAALLDQLRELAPDPEGWLHLHVAALNQGLLDRGHVSAPAVLVRLLRGLALDARSLAGGQAAWEMRHVAREHFRVRIPKGWDPVLRYAEIRRSLAALALETMLARIPSDAPAGAGLLVSFSAGDIVTRMADDLALAGQIRDRHAALEHALMFLHDQGVIVLQQGLGVFRQAMTVRLLPEAHGRAFHGGDFRPLEEHYHERVFQVHVMNEYARLGVERIRQAVGLALAYFAMGRTEFVRRFFAGRQEMLERATGSDSYRTIVESLQHPVQEAIVAAAPDANVLVLAGPGSGKTRVVVHRCAYLLRVERVPARSILLLCYNRQAAWQLRRRLRDLVGDDARGVTVSTYHGLAMRLLGHSFARGGRGVEINFEGLILDATALLRGENPPPGFDADEMRDQVLAGYRHILVDEYQDINAAQYDFISALAGRTLQDPERKLSILAVGDDDQNIYAFRATNVAFIRRFEADYGARREYLVENYRSTAHIIAAANRLIARNRDRMKLDQPGRVNQRRTMQLPGGRWTSLDPVTQGRVQVLRVADVRHQAGAVLAEMERTRSLDPTVNWSDFAVLARTTAELESLRALLDHAGLPCVWNADREQPIPLWRVREIANFFDRLHALRGGSIEIAQLRSLLPADGVGPWQTLLRNLLEEWRDVAGEAETPVVEVLEFLHEALRDARRNEGVRNGIFLTTVHAAKGLEFPHVFVLGGDWTALPAEQEEERRLFYVAMTRAEQRLTLLQRADAPHRFLAELAGPELVARTAPPGASAPAEVWLRGFHRLSLEDLYLDWAGRERGNEALARLAALHTGDPVQLVARSGVLICTMDGQPIGRLSKSGNERWAGRLGQVERITIAALLRRERADVTEPEYAQHLRHDQWEVPLLEIVTRESTDFAISPPGPAV